MMICGIEIIKASWKDKLTNFDVIHDHPYANALAMSRSDVMSNNSSQDKS